MSWVTDRAAPWLISVCAIAVAAASACAVPCQRDDDCGSGAYCGESDICVSDCLVNTDCPDNAFCTGRGECFEGNAPQVEVVAPVDTSVSGPFDLVVDLRFVGRQVTTTVRRDDDAPGSYCAPFAERTQVTVGLDGQVTETQLVFPAIVPAGTDFGLVVTAESRDGTMGQATTTFRYADFDALDAVAVRAPRAEDVLFGAASVPLDIAFAQAGDYWARIETPFGVPGPFLRVGTDALVNPSERLLLARGPQLVVVQNGLEASAKRCEIALDTGIGEGGIEVSMLFSSDEATGADLVILAERDGEVKTCSDNVAGACVARSGTAGLMPSGDRYRRLTSRDGVYGVAVVPRTVAGGVSATLQVAHKTRHVAFVGPGVLQSDVGEVWLAARLHVIDDALSIEMLDQFVIGLPVGAPSTW